MEIPKCQTMDDKSILCDIRPFENNWKMESARKYNVMRMPWNGFNKLSSAVHRICVHMRKELVRHGNGHYRNRENRHKLNVSIESVWHVPRNSYRSMPYRVSLEICVTVSGWPRIMHSAHISRHTQKSEQRANSGATIHLVDLFAHSRALESD